jgi:hypothetical protein
VGRQKEKKEEGEMREGEIERERKERGKDNNSTVIIYTRIFGHRTNAVGWRGVSIF